MYKAPASIEARRCRLISPRPMKHSGEKPSITELTCSIRGGQADDRGRATRWFMMANQIVTFFATQGEARAVPQIAVHILMGLLRWIRAATIAPPVALVAPIIRLEANTSSGV